MPIHRMSDHYLNWYIQGMHQGYVEQNRDQGFKLSAFHYSFDERVSVLQ